MDGRVTALGPEPVAGSALTPAPLAAPSAVAGSHHARIGAFLTPLA